MSKFKVGDKIVRVNTPYSWVDIGDVVEELTGYHYRDNNGAETQVVDSLWELDKPKYPNPPHKHKDIIIAWAKGAEVEYLAASSKSWKPIRKPSWYEKDTYRIKPAKSPTQLKVEELESKAAELLKAAKELKESL